MNEKEKVCPRCGKKYTGFPALSRLDNKTQICSECGVEEAMMDYFFYELMKIRNENEEV